MGFSPRTTEHGAERSRQISQPGCHRVKIVGYRRSSARRGGEVIFDLCDAQNRELTVRFSLSTPVLRTGELLRFVVAAHHLRAVEQQGRELSVANNLEFSDLVGCWILVWVDRNRRGYYDVIDFGPTPETPSPPKPSHLDEAEI